MEKFILSRRKQLTLCFYAILVAIVASALAKVLLLSINFFTQLFYFQSFSLALAQPAENHLGYWAILVPVLGGLIVGILAKFGSAAIRGHGIPEAMEKVLLDESKIPKRIVILKPLGSAIAIGSGGPFGAEGPIIATGGAFGSMLGQLIPGISAFERKVLLASGAAAGMTAVFGTPLAAVILAIELLLFEFRAQSFIPVSLSVAVAATIRFFLGDSAPFFEMPVIHATSLGSLCVFLFAGVLFGFLSIFVTKTVYFLEDTFDKLPIHWMWWPALGGVVVGLVGLVSPQSLGVGYSNITNALSGNFAIDVAIGLCVWKFVSWAIALSSGTSGGTLAPLLTFGSLCGLILGATLKKLFPELDIDQHVLALAGMAALFAGCSHAFFASIIFALESTQQPLGLVPLIGTCAIAYTISHWFMHESIMTEKIARRGVKVPRSYVPDETL